MKEVKIRNVVFGSARPQICLVLTNGDPGVLEAEISRAIEQGVEVFEFRADLTFDGKSILVGEKMASGLEASLGLVRELIGGRVLIFTYRSKEEGGQGALSLKEYEKLNLAAVGTGLVDIIDLELEKGQPFIERISEGCGKCLIQVSKHSLEGGTAKEEIIGIFLSMQEFPAERVAMTKLAVRANSEIDALELMAGAMVMKGKYADRPYTAIAMGEKGKVSRLAAELTGSALIFAKGQKSSAPGQMTVEEVKKNYVKFP